MKLRFHVLILLLIFISCNNNSEKKEEVATKNIHSETSVEYTSTYYLLRHAEKEKTDPTDPNPNLNAQGLERAQRWATYFEPILIDQIYITKYIRTKQTISVIAQQKKLNPILYDPHKIQLDEFLKETEGKTVLIAGHNNTTPMLVNLLIGKEQFKDMDENDNATLFKVTIKGNDKKVETITVE